MLVLRLQRTGRKNDPTYRVVLAEKTAPPKSGELEIIGHYLPARKPAVLSVKQDRITHWISKGAQPSNTLARLLKKEGMKDMDEYMTTYTKKKSKKAPAEAPAAPAPKAEAAPAPKEEAAPAPEAAGDTPAKEA